MGEETVEDRLENPEETFAGVGVAKESSLFHNNMSPFKPLLVFLLRSIGKQ